MSAEISFSTANVNAQKLSRKGREGGEGKSARDHLPPARIVFNFNGRDYGRLRQMIDVLNGL